MAKSVARRPGSVAKPAASSSGQRRAAPPAPAGAAGRTDPSDPPGGRGGPETPQQPGDRPQAREGLKPIGDERPHPSAAARPGKSSGSGLGAAEPDPLSDDEYREIRRRPRMRVEATAVGYYNHERRRVGDVFDIDATKGEVPKRDRNGKVVKGKDGTTQTEEGVLAFSPAWMRPVDRNTRTKTTTPNQALRQRHDEILAGKRGENEAERDDIGDRTVKDTGRNPLSA